MFEENARGPAGLDWSGLPLRQEPSLDEQVQETCFVGQIAQGTFTVHKLFAWNKPAGQNLRGRGVRGGDFRLEFAAWPRAIRLAAGGNRATQV